RRLDESDSSFVECPLGFAVAGSFDHSERRVGRRAVYARSREGGGVDPGIVDTAAHQERREVWHGCIEQLAGRRTKVEVDRLPPSTEDPWELWVLGRVA